ncbi:MAG: tRNA (adenosine(37)-N6)-threonylcarbamoyltransferase complex transferase subunit TsaD [bacterium]|nr:tRNA (adenosine(37)-N6)-threonylcarbamoyltransferase complex transferase subunit TsaD [bacterium]
MRRAAASCVLGIESSCDEMAAAIVSEGRVRSSVVHEQHAIHRPYGGVVPELASRDHVRQVSSVVAAALAEAELNAEEVTGIGVTSGPGLIGSLLVGLSFGKALGYRLGVPVVGVHHLVGHLVSAELDEESVRPPYIGLVASGGHTALYRIEADGEARALGATRDDAAGEAFDKVAKLLGLPYPGGPSISAAAEGGNDAAVDLPRPMLRSPGFDFSFSGLKTAVALEVERRGTLSEQDVRDIAASFEAAATDALVVRTLRAIRAEALDRLVVVGGVAANARLRSQFEAMAGKRGFQVTFPPLRFCTDNAAMIAAAAARLLDRGQSDGLELNAFSRAPLERAVGSRPATS